MSTNPGGGRGRGSAIGRESVREMFPVRYQTDTSGMAFRGRDAELVHLLRMAVRAVAQHLVTTVPHTRRTKAESQFLADCIRERRAASAETLARLLDIQSRAESAYYLSEQIRAIEAQILPSSPVCIHEASESEQEANAALDLAQLLFAKERSAIRAVQVAETGLQQLHRTRLLVDTAWRVARTGKVS